MLSLIIVYCIKYIKFTKYIKYIKFIKYNNNKSITPFN